VTSGEISNPETLQRPRCAAQPGADINDHHAGIKTKRTNKLDNLLLATR